MSSRTWNLDFIIRRVFVDFENFVRTYPFRCQFLTSLRKVLKLRFVRDGHHIAHIKVRILPAMFIDVVGLLPLSCNNRILRRELCDPVLQEINGRRVVSRSTGKAPFEVIYAYLPRSFLPIVFDENNPASMDFLENRMLAQLSA